MPHMPCLLAFLTFFACSISHASEATMFEYADTYCFGRFLVNVPREAVLDGQWHDYYAEPFKIGRGKEEFHAKVKAMLEKRKNITHEYEDHYERSEYPDNSNNQIIVSKHKSIMGDMSYALDVFALRKLGYYFYFTAEARSERQIERAVRNYRDIILPALRYRPDYEIPKEPGFCFGSGFIAGEGTPGWAEEADLAFHLKDNPDVKISIGSMVYRRPEPSLIEKSKGDEKGIHWDKEGKRTVNGLDGEEVLLSGRVEDETGIGHGYVWETPGEPKNPLKPGIRLEILTGITPANVLNTASSLPTPQVRALYEAIVKTIRLRPTTEAQAATGQPEEETK
ncbi:MAG: hypothetical protein LBP58_08395 [Azoarcus sp.]|jgi:hypothetical protein|nr:hypothetical protein [Azoarcus sp.]